MTDPRGDALQRQLAEQTLRILAVQAMKADGASEQEAAERVRKLFKGLRAAPPTTNDRAIAEAGGEPTNVFNAMAREEPREFVVPKSLQNDTAPQPTELERKVAAKIGDDPHAIAKRRALLEANEAVTAEYVKGYEWDAGEDGYHVPTESERVLIEDAIAGLLANDDFVRTFNAWQDECRFARSETPPQPASEADVICPMTAAVCYSGCISGRCARQLLRADGGTTKVSELVARVQGYRDALKQSVGSILSEYAANKIAQQAEDSAARALAAPSPSSQERQG